MSKRKTYNWLIILSELSMFVFIIAFSIYSYVNPDNFVIPRITWSVSAILLAVFLGLSFMRIRTLTKQLETSGIFCNDKLMLWHFGSFFVAAILSSIGNILLYTGIYKYNHDEIDKGLRLQIAC